MNRPFQFAVGIAIQMRTLSPIGGCVVMAVMRQRLGLFASTAADSIVVFVNTIDVGLSQVRTGFAPGMRAFGGGAVGPAPRPPAAGAPWGPPAPRCPWP